MAPPMWRALWSLQYPAFGFQLRGRPAGRGVEAGLYGRNDGHRDVSLPPAPSLLVASPQVASPQLPAVSPRDREKRVRRQVLEPRTLRAVFPLRAKVVARAGARPEAKARECQFAAVAPSYAHAVKSPDEFTGNIKVTTLDSLVWSVPMIAPDDSEAVARYLKHQDFPYRAITQTRELGIGGAMIDIGANTGRMSISRVVLGDATVAYCVEPDPLNFACLVRNVQANGLSGLVMPDRLAIGARNGTIRLERAKSPGGHRVITDEMKTGRETLEVPMTTLDAWVDRVGIDLDTVRLIKLDVQGGEVDVLDGAARVLSCCHIAWQIEVDVERLEKRGLAADDLFCRLRRHFTHFIDLNRMATGSRLRAVADLDDALGYVKQPGAGGTDVLFFTLPPA
jgi:FkbM family methyltransferase